MLEEFLKFLNKNGHVFISDGLIYIENGLLELHSEICPFVVTIPQTKSQLEYIKKQIKFLASKDGYKFTNTNNKIDITEYKRLIEIENILK